MLKPEFLFIMLLFTVGLAMTLFGLLFWKLNRVSRQLLNVTRGPLGKESLASDSRQAFDRDLALAEIKDRISKIRPDASVPGKYQYINSLVAHGLDSGQISQVLQIGAGEAEQLVHLALLKNKTLSTAGGRA